MSNVLEVVRFILAAVLMLFGLFDILTGIAGTFRFRYAVNRMHTAATVDSLGTLSLVLGVLVAVGWDASLTLKLILLVVFLWLTSPLCSHMVARLELWTNDEPEAHMTVEQTPDGVCGVPERKEENK